MPEDRSLLYHASVHVGKRLNLIATCLVSGLGFAPSVTAAGYDLVRSGVISAEEIWSGTVLVSGDVVVTNGGRLVVMPGTTVFAEALSDDQVSGEDKSRVEIRVSGGILVVEGTEAAPIRFTVTAREDGEAPTPGDWTGLRWSGPSATLSHCSVNHASIGLFAEVSTLQARFCNFDTNVLAGLSAQNYCTLVDCSFSGNQQHGFTGGAMNTFDRCRFLGNGGTGSGSTGTIYRDCVIAGNLRDPDHVRLGHYGAVAAGGVWVDNRIVQEASFERCVITNNFGTGVWSDRASFYAQDCLIADNDGAGIGGAHASFSGTFMMPDAVAITNCTILRNGGSGIDSGQITAVSSIVAGNAAGLVILPGTPGPEKSPLLARNSVVSDNAGLGIRCYGITEFTGNLIRNNATGMEVWATEEVVTLGPANSFFGNKPYEVATKTAAVVVADGSFWGEPTLSELAVNKRNLTVIFDVKDDPSVGQVAIRTWLEAPPAPIITTQPVGRTIVPGAQATLTVEAIGQPPLAYQWFQGLQGNTNQPVAGANSATFTTPSLTLNATYWVRVSNERGRVDSQSAQITVYLKVYVVPPVRTNVAFRLEVPAAVTGLWQIEQSDTLQDWDWTPVSGQDPVDAASAEPTLRLLGEAEPKKFFRLRLLP